MEVQFTPDVEKKLNEIASQSGRGSAATLVKDVVEGYFDELAQTRETLNAGSTTVTAAPGKSKTAVVTLNGAARQLLNKRHTLPALLTFTQGTTKLPSQRVSFKATEKK